MTDKLAGPDLLRAASARLRQLADAATEGPWSTRWNGQDYELVGAGEVIVSWLYTVSTTEPHASQQRAECDTADADYIAAMHPGVGTALADWLDSVADEADRHAAGGWGNDATEITDGHPITLARQILNTKESK
ncbi:hypothetical protein [Streptomyces aidingensis]|uniref:Uncharacterized protein n=1 Tax=Streptomyces aidingensis TaxID=910347 RepID=A0A1I1Q2X8_9ACTN|nr:hypothetical protein [Streptomyces aidingensis]SFD13583.1 hypothetical protein SAMN05421773_11066 [Streptomyces aidingensis]